MGPGRGSAAGSLVAYALEITDIDPIKLRAAVRALPQPGPQDHARHRHRLLGRRPRAGDAVRLEKYGRDRVAQIITFGTMAARAAVRDAGRVLGLPYGEVDRIAKLIPEGPGLKLAE